jgi:hypothetical protein
VSASEASPANILSKCLKAITEFRYGITTREDHAPRMPDKLPFLRDSASPCIRCEERPAIHLGMKVFKIGFLLRCWFQQCHRRMGHGDDARRE